MCECLPLTNWVCVNTDGACRMAVGIANCEGLTKRNNGYTRHLRPTYIAELWSVFEGLQLVWRMDFRKVE